jgi:hypothetical protein
MLIIITKFAPETERFFAVGMVATLPPAYLAPRYKQCTTYYSAAAAAAPLRLAFHMHKSGAAVLGLRRLLLMFQTLTCTKTA